ncbi:MAG: ABC transporter substrate-binding protein [Caulobacteraceae bacterium]|nr:ABC transporter substrate-binding protein [Caulobacteraceae bacterium]
MATKVSAACALMASVVLGMAATAARADDPAAGQVQKFDAALLETMKAGLGAEGRAHRLTPTIEQTFDIPAMIRFAVGPAWTGMSEADHTALAAAFERYTAASYAHNFDSYSGQKFTVDPNVDSRGVDKLVKTQLASGDGAPVSIVYRMRDTSGPWKIIDVYYQGTISQLTTSRSDFAATVASGGAKALVAHLDAQTAKLLK